MKSYTKYIILFGLNLLFLVVSCIEEIGLKTQDFESALVVEATLTDELQHQIVELSRTYRLEQDTIIRERNATVKIIDEQMAVYNFQEIAPGKYQSISQFQAVKNRNYKLEILTSNGKEYNSTNQEFSQHAKIDDAFFERGMNEDNEEGISVKVNAFDPTGNSKYYRFEYEETYKIVAPLYVPFKLIVSRLDDPEILPFFSLVPREEEVKVCYNTTIVKKNIVATTNNQIEDRLDNYRIRFLNKDDQIISHRYSILVKMFVQSREAFTFYNTLNNLAQSENIFSENQAGFLSGNMSSSTDPEEKVVGYFEVSSVDLKRIYFNYTDFFDELNLGFITGCHEYIIPSFSAGNGHDEVSSISPLENALLSGLLFYDMNESRINSEGDFAPYRLVRPECGDCTVLGTTTIPDFWIE